MEGAICKVEAWTWYDVESSLLGVSATGSIGKWDRGLDVGNEAQIHTGVEPTYVTWMHVEDWNLEFLKNLSCSRLWNLEVKVLLQYSPVFTLSLWQDGSFIPPPPHPTHPPTPPTPTPPTPCNGELWMQKLKSHLVGTQSLNVLPLKPGVGQYIAANAMLTARDFFFAYFYPSAPITCIFFKTSPDFSCFGCG